MTLEIIRGDDSTFQATFTNNDGVAIDLTEGTVFFTVKEDLDDPDSQAIISKEYTSSSAPTTGIMNIVLDNTDTDVEVGRYYFDIQFKKSGNIFSTERGRFIVNQDITLRVS